MYRQKLTNYSTKIRYVLRRFDLDHARQQQAKPAGRLKYSLAEQSRTQCYFRLNASVG